MRRDENAGTEEEKRESGRAEFAEPLTTSNPKCDCDWKL
jgi:hypothetical protein